MTDMTPEELAEARRKAQQLIGFAELYRQGPGEVHEDVLWEAEDVARALLYHTTARPIAEAPKDGTPVFARCYDDYDQVVIYRGGYWMSEMTERYVIPTYFYPLPPAPEE